MTTQIPSLTLNNGINMPQVGLGTFLMKPGETAAAVKAAINIGYRHIDTAYVYQNEEQIGQAIQEVLAEGVVKRENLFIVTKLYGQFLSPEHVREGFDQSLKMLKVDYIDLYLMHTPYALKYDRSTLWPKNGKGEFLTEIVDYVDTWKEMEKLVDEGLVKSIGVSNFNSKQIERILLAAKHKPVVNEIEVHPYFVRKKLIKFCQSKGIAVTAFCSLGAPAHPNLFENVPKFMDDSVVKAIAKKYQKSPAHVLLRYSINLGCVVIPKSVNPDHMRENAQIFDFELSQEDMAILEKNNLGKPISMYWQRFKDHPHYPFNEE